MRRRGTGWGTLLVHAGSHVDWETGSVGTPVFQAATFLYPRKRRPDGSWHEDRSGYIYTRNGNPTIAAVEKKVAAIEGGYTTVAFGSGMAAIAGSVFPFLGPGVVLASQSEIYGGAWILFDRDARALGVKTAFTPHYDVDRLVESLPQDSRLLFTEMPTNPFNRLLDVSRLRRQLDRRFGRRRPLWVMDATLATPLNFRPLDHGVDVSVHSATKYLGGHSDVIAGVATSTGRVVEKIRDWRYHMGGCMDPHQAFLLERGLKTLEVRLRRQEENATAVARFLDSHRKVAEVHHLSLPSHPDYRLGRRLLRGPGGLLSFRLREKGRRAAVRFLTHLGLFAAAPSLGGVESLATIPRETSHRNHTEAEARAVGITSNLVRLSVGIEDASDLISDVRKALVRV